MEDIKYNTREIEPIGSEDLAPELEARIVAAELGGQSLVIRDDSIDLTGQEEIGIYEDQSIPLE